MFLNIFQIRSEWSSQESHMSSSENSFEKEEFLLFDLIFCVCQTRLTWLPTQTVFFWLLPFFGRWNKREKHNRLGKLWTQCEIQLCEIIRSSLSRGEHSTHCGDLWSEACWDLPCSSCSCRWRTCWSVAVLSDGELPSHLRRLQAFMHLSDMRPLCVSERRVSTATKPLWKG